MPCFFRRDRFACRAPLPLLAAGVNEGLFLARRCPMNLPDVGDELESRPESREESFGTVAPHCEPTAVRRAVQSEGGDDQVPSRPEGTVYQVYVPPPISCVRKEMEDRAVVPYIEGKERQRGPRDVRLDPCRLPTARPKPGPGALERGRRDVEHRHMPQLTLDQRIHEGGISAANINDPAGRSNAYPGEQLERA